MARYADATTAITPPSNDVGLILEVTGSPMALPNGTRPEASPPTMVPKKKGEMAEAPANIAP